MDMVEYLDRLEALEAVIMAQAEALMGKKAFEAAWTVFTVGREALTRFGDFVLYDYQPATGKRLVDLAADQWPQNSEEQALIQAMQRRVHSAFQAVESNGKRFYKDVFSKVDYPVFEEAEIPPKGLFVGHLFPYRDGFGSGSESGEPTAYVPGRSGSVMAPELYTTLMDSVMRHMAANRDKGEMALDMRRYVDAYPQLLYAFTEALDAANQALTEDEADAEALYRVWTCTFGFQDRESVVDGLEASKDVVFMETDGAGAVYALYDASGGKLLAELVLGEAWLEVDAANSRDSEAARAWVETELGEIVVFLRAYSSALEELLEQE